MDELEEYYGRETFALYSLFAKVPGKKSWPRAIFVTFSILVLLWGTLYQEMRIVANKFQRDVIIELLPTTAATGGALAYIPYVTFTTAEDYNNLLSIVLDDIREERTAEEDAIKKQYAKNAKMFINGYTTLCGLAVCAAALFGFVPYFLDILVPLNETRERELFFRGELFIDEQKYYYYIYFLECCNAFVLTIVIIVTENMSIIIEQHACGMAAVLGHRLENITEIDEHKLLGGVDYDRFVTCKLERCIEEHTKFLHFAALIAAFYDIPLTLVLTGTFSALTVSLVQVTDPELINTTIAFFTIAQICQLFLLSYMGQSEIDASEKIAVNAYNADWHICSPNARKLLQLIILRSSKPCMVVARSMYTLSMESFLSVMQTVVSCYMVLRQTH